MSLSELEILPGYYGLACPNTCLPHVSSRTPQVKPETGKHTLNRFVASLRICFVVLLV